MKAPKIASAAMGVCFRPSVFPLSLPESWFVSIISWKHEVGESWKVFTLPESQSVCWHVDLKMADGLFHSISILQASLASGARPCGNKICKQSAPLMGKVVRNSFFPYDWSNLLLAHVGFLFCSTVHRGFLEDYLKISEKRSSSGVVVIVQCRFVEQDVGKWWLVSEEASLV